MTQKVGMAVISTNGSKLLSALHSDKAVVGDTHTFYRYPARFSPEFVREVIRQFTKPGDVVADPFMGGGTSAVEALAEGRRFIGNDINELSNFVSNVKTTLLTTEDEARVLGWAAVLPQAINLHWPEPADPEWAAYQKNIPWRIRKLFSIALKTLEVLPTHKQQNFARCSLLRTGQLALDCQSSIPTKGEIIGKHGAVVTEMLAGAADFKERFRSSNDKGTRPELRRRLLCSDTSRLHESKLAQRFGTPKLVVTSPPYLGVHVLYHRWQILGRRETSAPYWLANKTDGHGGSFYTFADRNAKEPTQYLEKLQNCFGAVAQLINRKSLIAQLVAFSDPEIQLPMYLKVMDDIGLDRCEIFESHAGKPATRIVPNRRWYASLNPNSNADKEYLLIHRKR